MRKSNFMMLVVFLLNLFGTDCAQSSKLPPQQQLVQGVPCVGEVKFHENGKIKSCKLSMEFSVEGYDFPKASSILFNAEGTLTQCILGDSARIFGQAFPVGTTLFFGRWGQKVSFWLPSNTVIQGHLVAGSNDGIGNSIYPNGKLKVIWLAEDENIDGVPCTSSGNILRFGLGVIPLGTQRMVWFHENGRLQQAMLSRDFTIQSQPFSKGDIVKFDAKGRLELETPKLE